MGSSESHECEHCHTPIGNGVAHTTGDCVARLRVTTEASVARLRVMIRMSYDGQGRPIDRVKLCNALQQNSIIMDAIQVRLNQMDEEAVQPPM